MIPIFILSAFIYFHHIAIRFSLPPFSIVNACYRIFVQAKKLFHKLSFIQLLHWADSKKKILFFGFSNLLDRLSLLVVKLQALPNPTYVPQSASSACEFEDYVYDKSCRSGTNSIRSAVFCSSIHVRPFEIHFIFILGHSFNSDDEFILESD